MSNFINACPSSVCASLWSNSFNSFLFSNINKTQGHTMNLSDLLFVEFFNDNLKMFNQACEETILAFGVDLDEGVHTNKTLF